MDYIHYKKSYPNIEKAIRDGAKLFAYELGGIIFVRIRKKGQKESISRGQHLYLSNALCFTDEDFGLSEEQCEKKRGSYIHGKENIPGDLIDMWMKRDNGFTIVRTDNGSFLCYLDSYPFGSRKEKEKVYWDTGTTIMEAISNAIILSKAERDKKELFKIFGVKE